MRIAFVSFIPLTYKILKKYKYEITYWEVRSGKYKIGIDGERVVYSDDYAVIYMELYRGNYDIPYLFIWHRPSEYTYGEDYVNLLNIGDSTWTPVKYVDIPDSSIRNERTDLDIKALLTRPINTLRRYTIRGVLPKELFTEGFLMYDNEHEFYMLNIPPEPEELEKASYMFVKR